MNNTTIVTGIWDLGRDALSEGWGRKFDHYIDNFKKLLSIQNLNLAIFIDPKLEPIVWEHRDRKNTVVYHHAVDEFSGNFFPFFDQVQKIRNSDNWQNQVGWLKDSTQARMPYYNPMVMSKMFLLHNAKIFNPFNSDYYFWLDGGITNTVHPGYFSHDNVIEKIQSITDKMLFVCFPYETTTEIHGFDISGMRKYAKSDNVNRVARAGFFGGHKDYISSANNLYYSLLNDTLADGYMGTEESIFTLMTYLEPDLYRAVYINADGLLSTFFENMKNLSKDESKISFNKTKPIVYINAFNSPEQLEMVIESFIKYDKRFLDKTEKVLINNSTKENLFSSYDTICDKYNFKDHIKKGNLGICRARQLAAEHFYDSSSQYMLFFEDDMLLDMSETKCSFGLNKKVDNLFDMLIRIMNIEKYDFLKLSFSEFYGHNGQQWSWHNVPSPRKEEYFGSINSKPNTKFNNIHSLNGVVYADGEIYYSNWPHIINQEGNQKCFLDTKWDNPFEQTWMSHIYSLTKQGKVKPAILLHSPITHNRVHHYEAQERKEN
ncbi:hypothetical protein EBQ81_04580 [bacterium]|nr:hypothetical protein [bacterium]